MMTARTPFHEGELRVQARLGVRDTVAPWAGHAIRACLPDEHRSFYGSLPFLVAAARDRKGRPWATLLTGPPGFARSPDPRRLVIDAQPLRGDALEGALSAGTDVGLLGIELATRRRNRVNGRIVASASSALAVEVRQAFGNCPQYINERAWRRVPQSSEALPARRSERLTLAMRERIRRADTFFIASGHGGRGDDPTYGMDVSHRGGEPGFVHVHGERRLLFPDYAGNNYFNTIGNLMMDPRAGMLFVDFERGSLLQLTGHARIDWDTESISRFPGAQRLVIFELDEAVELEAALPLRWGPPGEHLRTLRLIDKRPESVDVASFFFEARDGGPLPEFTAGQHLPIRIRIPGYREPVRRTYSLSSAPGTDRYRITVKRAPMGLASRFLHDALEIGAFVDAGRPAGEFVLRGRERPVVLLSAGIGLTPMVSMLHALAAGATRDPVWFIHGARDGMHHPLAREVRDLVAGFENAHLRVVYSRPRSSDVPGVDFDDEGHVDAGSIADLLPGLEADFYLCGPAGFMAYVQSGLVARGVEPDHIHVETFGPLGPVGGA